MKISNTAMSFITSVVLVTMGLFAFWLALDTPPVPYHHVRVVSVINGQSKVWYGVSYSHENTWLVLEEPNGVKAWIRRDLVVSVEEDRDGKQIVFPTSTGFLGLLRELQVEQGDWPKTRSTTQPKH